MKAHIILSILSPLLSMNSVGAELLDVQNGVDGFNAYCTSNRDGTGACFNEESKKSLSCIVIPGQLIDCKSRLGRKFQCVLINSITATQAEFNCTRETELMLLEEGSDTSSFADAFTSPIN